MKPALLILAAGIGSRYGGVKQMDQIGPGGESIIDYSVYDAIRAGFGKIVFVVNKKIENDFRELWEPKLKGKIDHDFVIQDPEDLPEGFHLPGERVKPWGTGQAVMAARFAIDTPFAVINADDFYGKESYRLICEYLSAQDDNNKYCMVGYQLQNTLSDYGSVSRGVCAFDDDHHLSKITEITNIERKSAASAPNGSVIGYENIEGEFAQLDKNTLVSMNIWGFTPGLFQFLERDFAAFLGDNIENNKAEFLLPTVINDMVTDGVITVKMLESDFPWFGVTYQEDKPMTIEKVGKMVEEGIYPPLLWKK
ncbi:MAG: sugar phosphate nucleotidyltransferase [Bacteroidota bacterium]